MFCPQAAFLSDRANLNYKRFMKVFEQPYFSEVPSFFLVFNEAVKSQGSKKELYMKI